MSFPGLELIILVGVVAFTGPVVWGYFCSRVRRFGLLLLLLPPLFLVVISPGLLHLAALPFFAAYGLLVGTGYIVGFLWSKRSKSK